MTPKMCCSFRVRWLWAAVPLLLLLGGCANDHPRHQARGPRRPPPPPLAGEEIFFNGQITAELKVGAGGGFEDQEENKEHGSEGRKGGAGSGGFHLGLGGGGGGGGMGGGGMGMGGGGGMGGDMGGGGGMGGGGMGGGDMGGGPPGGGDEDSGNRMAGMRGGGGLPSVMIHLRFINHGSEPAELHVKDFLSPLGNFVVQPEKVSLAPGGAVEVEPMTSRVAAEVGSTSVTLVLLLHGQAEKKTVTLHVVSESPAGAPPAQGEAPPPPPQ